MSKKNEVSGGTLTNDKTVSDAINYNPYTNSFDIRNHLDRLEKSPKGGRYHICPVCGGHSLHISEADGYKCWSNECDPRDIREAIAPWSESPRNPQNNGQSYRSNYNGSRKPQAKSKPQPAQIPDHVELATFTPEDFPERQGNKTIYKYSDTQRVERTDPPKGKKKYFRSIPGQTKQGKGLNRGHCTEKMRRSHMVAANL